MFQTTCMALFLTSVTDPEEDSTRYPLLDSNSGFLNLNLKNLNVTEKSPKYNILTNPPPNKKRVHLSEDQKI
jgi:hypothetical protein